jgi:uncharacterized repeat protein (TIGR01451 family)
VYATIPSGDSLTTGILMRVERCIGTLCAGFVFVGNAAVQYPGTAFAQFEYIDSGLAYGTVYRYRVRFENIDGPSGYSSAVEVDTTTHATSACTSGVITDFSDEVRQSGNRALYEYLLEELRNTGQRTITEFVRDELRQTGLRNVTEYVRDEVRVTGLRVLIEFVDQIETDLRVTKTVSNPTSLLNDIIVWSVLVENVSLIDATDVVVNDIIPVGTTYISHVASVGTYDEITGIWTIGTLLAGTSATLAITAEVTATGTHTNTATASSDIPDATPGDNTDNAVITIARPPCPGLPLPTSFQEDDADTEQQANTCQDEL